MPFITEELWEKISPVPRAALIGESWPRDDGLGNAEAAGEMDWVVRLISQVRSIRAEMNVPPAAEITLYLRNADTTAQARLERHRPLIRRLARLKTAEPLVGEVPKGSVQDVLDEATLVLPLADVIDIAQERARLEREAAKLDNEAEKIEAKLANRNFVAKAPPEVVEEQRERLDGLAASRTKLNDALTRLAQA